MKRPTGFIHSATISITDFRKEPGEYFLAIERGRQSFVVTRRGKPIFRMAPVDDVTEVLPDGTILGEAPLTARAR